jgi:cell division control protein 7
MSQTESLEIPPSITFLFSSILTTSFTRRIQNPLSRSVEEQTEIQREMAVLYKAVPKLKGQYQLLDRLGTGTFSSVYKAIDLLYDDWDNQPWLGNHPPESTAYYQSSGPAYKGRGGRGPKRRSADSSGDVDMEADSNPKDGNVYVAVKRIYTTSGPERIKNELSILETCRGCRHASQIITAFRNYDQVVIVLPYQRNMDFRVRCPSRYLAPIDNLNWFF